MPYITLTPSRIYRPSPVRIIPPIRMSPTMARIRGTHNTNCLKQRPHPTIPATGTCIGRWNGMTDLRRRYAPSKAFVGIRGLMFRISAQHVIRGHDDAGMGCMGIDDMAGLVRSAEEEAVGL